jgi:hypothetical protein
VLKLVALILGLLLAGCATAGNTINLSITNTTPYPLTLCMGTSIFQKSVIIMPGQTWKGWVDRRLISSEAWGRIEVTNFNISK